MYHVWFCLFFTVYKNIPNATRSNKVLVISPRYKELSKKRFEPSTTSAGNSHKSNISHCLNSTNLIISFCFRCFCCSYKKTTI